MKYLLLSVCLLSIHSVRCDSFSTSSNPQDMLVLKQALIHHTAFTLLASGVFEHYQKTGEGPSEKVVNRVMEQDNQLMQTQAGRRKIEERENRWKKIITETPSIAAFMIETGLPVLYALYIAKGKMSYYAAVLSLMPEIIDIWEASKK